MQQCSVIILNWNGEAMLRRYLPSVIQHTQGEGIEVVVADNGSTDASLEYLRTQPIRLITLDKNYGFAEGYNRAIELWRWLMPSIACCLIRMLRLRRIG